MPRDVDDLRAEVRALLDCHRVVDLLRARCWDRAAVQDAVLLLLSDGVDDDLTRPREGGTCSS